MASTMQAISDFIQKFIQDDLKSSAMLISDKEWL